MDTKRLLISRIVTALAWAISLTSIAVALWAFGFDRYDPESGRYYDGFRRELHPSSFPGPHGRELSPGALWSIVDTLVGLALFAACTSLFVLARRIRRAAKSHDDEGN